MLEWFPHVVVDLHEMSGDSSYYFELTHVDFSDLVGLIPVALAAAVADAREVLDAQVLRVGVVAPLADARALDAFVQ